MDFNLISSLPKEHHRDSLFLYGSQVRDAGVPWIGAFVCYEGKKSKEVPAIVSQGALMTDKEVSFWGLLFLSSPPPSGSSDLLAQFRDSLTVLAQADMGKKAGHVFKEGMMVLWLPELGAFPLQSPHLTFSKHVKKEYYVLMGKALPILAAGGDDRHLCIQVDQKSSRLAFSDDVLLVNMQSPKHELVFLDVGQKPPHNIKTAIEVGTTGEGTVLKVPLTGATAGCFIFHGAPREGFALFETGFIYEIREVAGAVSRLVFPLFEDQSLQQVTEVQGTLDPLSGNDPQRNWIQTGLNDRLASNFKLSWDAPSWLQPMEENWLGGVGRFVGAVTGSGRRYLTPDGSFRCYTGKDDASSNTVDSFRLICGLNPMESLEIQSSDYVFFTPAAKNANPAAKIVDYVQAHRTDDGWRFEIIPETQPRSGAAWAVVSWDHAYSLAPLPVYRWGNPQAVWFSTADGSNGVLERIDFPQRDLTKFAISDRKSFPLLPYAGLRIADGGGRFGNAKSPGADIARDIEQFERSLIAHSRHNLIMSMGGELGGGSGLNTILSSNGYLATLNAGGKITQIDLGTVGDCSLQFAASGGSALPDEIVDLFLHPQLFMVASCDTDKNFIKDYLKARFKMGDFSIPITFTEADLIRPGDYKTVLLVKSGHGTVDGRAAAPKSWSGYGLFNRTGDDPDGRAMSAWLTDYIAAAKKLYAEGRGLSSLKNFCDLVGNPEWNGFLFLRVPVSGAFDPNLGFLSAAMPAGSLFAHHLGCVNGHVRAEKSNEVSSAFFGVIHYLNPVQPASTNAPLFVAGADNEKFILLRLDAVFARNALQEFSCETALVMGNMLGDAVVKPQGVSDAANAVVFQGRLTGNGLRDAVQFTTRPGQSSRFYLNSCALDFVEIDTALLTSDGDAQKGSLTFQLGGWLSTLPLPSPQYDLLSFDAIGFSGLTFTMTYNNLLQEGANKPRFSFVDDLSKLTLLTKAEQATGDTAITPERAASYCLYRRGSLADHLPLNISGIVLGLANTGPATFGYRALGTSTATGADAVDFTKPWHGLRFDLPLGGGGALDSAALLSASLLLSWNVGADAKAGFAPFILITGPSGVSLNFQIEGVIGFGAGDMTLIQDGDGADKQFYLKLSNIGLTVMSFTFPPKGTTNVLIGGIKDQRMLGWVGAYDGGTPPELLK